MMKEEFKENAASFLADALRFGWCEDTWETRADGVYESTDKDAVRIIEFASLSTFSNVRGGAHPDTLMFVLDEFMPESERYPKGCATALGSLAMTILRGRPGSKIFALSNAVKVKNPFFARMRIYPQKGKAVTLYKDKAAVIERCTGYNRAVPEDSQFNRMLKALGMTQYEDLEEDPLAGLVAPMPKGSKPFKYVILNHGIYYREWDANGRRWFTEWKGAIPNGTFIFAANPAEAGAGVLVMPNHIRKHLQEIRDTDGARFTDANVMYGILDIIYTYERRPPTLLLPRPVCGRGEDFLEDPGAWPPSVRMLQAYDPCAAVRQVYYSFVGR